MKISLIFLVSSLIFINCDNPLSQTVYTADPAPMVYNDVLYLFTVHDADGASYFEIPDFDTIRDVPDFASVKENPSLYSGCWVSWGGKVSNANTYEDGSYSCDLIIGDEQLRHYEGTVLVRFEVVPNVESDQYVKILGQLEVRGSNVTVKGRSLYQTVKRM